MPHLYPIVQLPCALAYDQGMRKSVSAIINDGFWQTLSERYPPSVITALRLWWQQHPGEWPYERPDEMSYWLTCLKRSQAYYSRAWRLREDIAWYAKLYRS